MTEATLGERAVLVLRSSRVPFLVTLILAVVVSGFLQYLWQYAFPWIPVVKGQPPGVWSGLLLVGVALVLWFLAPSRRVSERWLIGFLAVLLVLWASELVISRIHGDAFNYAVWAYPVIVGMLALKLPTKAEMVTGIVFLAWLAAGILVVTRALEMLSVIPVAPVGDYLLGYEEENYWLPLSGWLGPEGRWPGPFFHNSQTGNMGAYLLVAGVALRRRSSIAFIVVGALTLLLTSSRGSMVGAAIGVAIALFLGDYAWNRRLRRGVLVAATLVVGTVAVALAVIASPNLTGRDRYWSAFLDLWQTSPWIGVGITGRMANAPDFINGTNGHNLFVDALAHYGVLPAAGVILAIVIASVLAVKASLCAVVLPLALTATYVFIGLAQSDYNWMVTSNPWLVLVLATILASNVVAAPARPEVAGSGTPQPASSSA